MKFQIGDPVRILVCPWKTSLEGLVGKVRDILTTHYYDVEVGGRRWTFQESQLETAVLDELARVLE